MEDSAWVSLDRLGFPDYEAHPDGKIRRRGSERELRGCKAAGGYRQVSLFDPERKMKNRAVHRLIAQAFHGDPPQPGMSVDHINRIPYDNRLVNLRWATAKQQRQNVRVVRELPTRRIPILRIDDTGEIIAWYDCLRDAANALYLEIEDQPRHARKTPNSILNTLRFRIKDEKQYMGYYWLQENVEQSDKGEEWFDVPPSVQPGIRELQYSNLGRLRNKKNRRLVGLGRDNAGYRLYAYVTKEGRDRCCPAHVVIAAAVYGPIPPGYVVNHLDGTKDNNVPSNLEVVTQKQNMEHAAAMGKFSQTPNSSTIVPVSAKDSEGNTVMHFTSITEACRHLGVNTGSNFTSHLDTGKMYRNYFWYRTNQ